MGCLLAMALFWAFIGVLFLFKLVQEPMFKGMILAAVSLIIVIVALTRSGKLRASLAAMGLVGLVVSAVMGGVYRREPALEGVILDGCRQPLSGFTVTRRFLRTRYSPHMDGLLGSHDNPWQIYRMALSDEKPVVATTDAEGKFRMSAQHRWGIPFYSVPRPDKARRIFYLEDANWSGVAYNDPEDGGYGGDVSRAEIWLKDSGVLGVVPSAALKAHIDKATYQLKIIRSRDITKERECLRRDALNVAIKAFGHSAVETELKNRKWLYKFSPSQNINNVLGFFYRD